MVVKAVSVGTFVPSDGAVVEDGDSATVTKADGTGSLSTVTFDVSGGSVVGAALAGNAAIVTDNDLNQIVNNADGSAGGAMQINVSANAPTFELFNAAQRIATNLVPITVVDGNGKTAGATIAVTGGVFGNFPLTAATNCIVSSAQALTGVAPTGTYTNTVTFTVANGRITAIVLS